MFELFHPAIARWFRAKCAAPPALQLLAWSAIAGGQHALIGAPTGPGKTLASTLAAIERLVLAAVGSQFPGGTWIAYVSPLKALSSDIQRCAQIG
jgi:ATP-dependent Lhr-like helicase